MNTGEGDGKPLLKNTPCLRNSLQDQQESNQTLRPTTTTTTTTTTTKDTQFVTECKHRTCLYVCNILQLFKFEFTLTSFTP
jgi:hypothetical protein